MSFPLGFVYSQDEYAAPVVGSVKEGSNQWFDGFGRWHSDRGASSAGSTGSVSDLQIIRSQLAGCIGQGNIWSAFGVDWLVGNGFVGGSSIGSSPGVLSLIVGGSPVPAGLARPNPPTIAASATAGTNTGSYAVAVAAYRETTGAISTISLLSNAISVTNKKITITFPSAPSGTTHWLVYGTRRGFGSIGPAFRITTVAPVTVATASITIDWVDGYLGDLGSLINDPPPACTNVTAIGGSVGALGTGSGGYGCRFSLVGSPEAFPPGFHFDLPVREAITGVHPGVDGVVIVTTRNGVMSLVATGSELIPVLPRVIFGHVGCTRQNNLAIVFDQFYMFSDEEGLMRTQGSDAPDFTFAAPVASYFRDNGFSASNTVVVHDQGRNSVIVASGTKAVPFNYVHNVWSAPITLPGSVSAGIAHNQRGVLQIGSSGFALDRAGGSPSGGWFLRGPYLPIGDGHLATLKEVNIRGGNSATVDLWDGRTGVSVSGLFPHAFSATHGAAGRRSLRPNRKVRSLALRTSGSAGNQSSPAAVVRGHIDPIAA